MVDTQALRGAIVAAGYNLDSFANAIGMKRRTLGNRLKSGIWGSDEIENVIDVLNLSDPARIFFADRVT